MFPWTQHIRANDWSSCCETLGPDFCSRTSILTSSSASTVQRCAPDCTFKASKLVRWWLSKRSPDMKPGSRFKISVKQCRFIAAVLRLSAVPGVNSPGSLTASLLVLGQMQRSSGCHGSQQASSHGLIWSKCSGQIWSRCPGA